MSVEFIDKLGAKVINYGHKLDGLSLLVPKTSSGSGVVITSYIGTLLGVLVHQDSGLW